MHATDLSELSAFDAVARHKSFTRAAKEREVTASAISHAVSNLENKLGVRLLNRTTRNVSLTDAGEMLHARLVPAFDVSITQNRSASSRRQIMILAIEMLQQRYPLRFRVTTMR